MTSFINTGEQLYENRDCYFSLQALLPEGFPFHQFLLTGFVLSMNLPTMFTLTFVLLVGLITYIYTRVVKNKPDYLNSGIFNQDK